MIHKDSTSKTLKRLDGTIADSDKDVDSNLTRIQNSRPHLRNDDSARFSEARNEAKAQYHSALDRKKSV